jgi:hypothetical protein
MYLNIGLNFFLALKVGIIIPTFDGTFKENIKHIALKIK